MSVWEANAVVIATPRARAATCATTHIVHAQLPARLAEQDAGRSSARPSSGSSRSIARRSTRWTSRCASWRSRGQPTRSSSSPSGDATACAACSSRGRTGASAASARGGCRSRRSATATARSCMTPATSVRAVATRVRRATAATRWFTDTPARSCSPTTTQRADPQIARRPRSRRASRSCHDIFDVWFESGSSLARGACGSGGSGFPVELYLEGSDQHRGWFQLSLLPAICGVTGQSAVPERCSRTASWSTRTAARCRKTGGNALSGRRPAQGLRRRRLPLVGEFAHLRERHQGRPRVLRASRARATARCATRCASCSANLDDYDARLAARLICLDRSSLDRLGGGSANCASLERASARRYGPSTSARRTWRSTTSATTRSRRSTARR